MAVAPSDTSVDAISDIYAISTSDRSSSVLSPRSLNADFRDGVRNRPGLFGMSISFEDPENDQEVFEKGNVQGFFPYEANAFRPSGFLFLIAGIVFWGGLAGRAVYIRRLFAGLDPTVLHSWNCQAFGFSIIQNGVDRPIIFNGFEAFQSNPDAGEIPIGTLLAFNHHRVITVSADGQDKVAVSNLWRADLTTNVYTFTESTVWANAGVFALHANYGRLMHLGVVPQIKRTPNGNGPLLMAGTNGAQTLNLQGPRGSWIDGQIQDTANMGGGIASLHGSIMHNGKLFYVSQDGIRQWSPTTVDAITGDSDALISGDVQHYWTRSDPNARTIIPAGSHDSRLFFGIYPEIKPSESWGAHRFCNAWLTLDTMRRSRNGQTLPLSWYGLNCGIRPIQYVNNLLLAGVQRTYVISHDEDGTNRVYECTNFLRDDIVEGNAKKIKWSVDYPIIGTDARSGKWLLPKSPSQLRIDYAEADGEVQIEAFSRPDDAFCLEPWGQAIKACVPENDQCGTRPLHRGRRVVGAPDSGCGLAATQYRVRLKISGATRISNLIGELRTSPGASTFSREDSLCGSCSEGNSSASSCCEEEDLYQAVNQPTVC